MSSACGYVIAMADMHMSNRPEQGSRPSRSLRRIVAALLAVVVLASGLMTGAVGGATAAMDMTLDCGTVEVGAHDQAAPLHSASGGHGASECCPLPAPALPALPHILGAVIYPLTQAGPATVLLLGVASDPGDKPPRNIG